MTTMLERMEQAAREAGERTVPIGMMKAGDLAALGVRAAYAWLEAEGMVIVPKEPTDAMVLAVCRVHLPALFKHGLESLPTDGKATREQKDHGDGR